MAPVMIFLGAVIFLYGIIFGSFLNVCIYRIPKKESIVSTPSHCMNCGYRLKWYDLVPLFSFLFLKGRCRQCKTKLSWQYPVVEALNGVLWVLTFAFGGMTWDSLLGCCLVSALLVLSVIDWRTYEIPLGINIFIAVLGVIHLLVHCDQWLTYVLGFFCVSAVLFLLYLFTKGRGMGGGDIKLMAAAGLFLGWKLVIVAFLFGCLYACVIHIARMMIYKKDSVLAFGPYLSGGILTALWFGERIIQWYVNLLP